MNYDELKAAIRAILPYADLALDKGGQIVIYTNLTHGEEDKLEPYEV